MTEQLRDIDEIILKVKRELPLSRVYQLEVKSPYDDDGLWYFYLPGIERDIQIDRVMECARSSSRRTNKAHTMREKLIP